MRLYETNDKLEECLDIEDATERRLALKRLELNVNNKINSICRKCVNWDSDIEAIDSQIARLQELKKIRGGKRQWLADFLKGFLLNNGIYKVEVPEYTVTVAKCPDSVEIIDESKIPAEYVIIQTIQKIDKIKLKSDLKEKNIPGARLIQDKTSLRIK